MKPAPTDSPPSRVAMPPYRTNARARDAYVAARKNSYVDHILYWAPLRRLTLVIAVSLPFALALAWSIHRNRPEAILYVAAVMVTALLSSMVIDGYGRQWRTTTHLVLIAAYAPLSLVFMLTCWLSTGMWLPPSWTVKKKS